MTCTPVLLQRNRTFSDTFGAGDLPVFPKLNIVIVACIDARVDPAHILGLDLGDAVVIRNSGGRVTPAVIEELGALAFLVNQISGQDATPFEVILLQHTQCGAERYADPNLQQAIKANIGVDVTSIAINDHNQSLHSDIETLRSAPEVPSYLTVSGMIYDVANGEVCEVVAPSKLG